MSLLLAINVVLHHVLVAGTSRIVNGKPTATKDYPFMVSLRLAISDGKESHFCGGTILRQDPLAVLSAGRCISLLDPVIDQISQDDLTYEIYADIGRDIVVARVSGDDFESYRMIDVIVHPDMQIDKFGKTGINDIAILFFDGSTEKAAIDQNQNQNLDLTDTTVRLIGYGASQWNATTLTDTMEYADLVYINDTTCNLGYSEWWRTYYNESFLELLLAELNGQSIDDYPWEVLSLPDSQFCAVDNESTACKGDTGGPVLLIEGDNYKQIGIISFGTDNCEPGYPVVFTDVSYYSEWITETLNSFPDSITVIPYSTETVDNGQTGHDIAGITIGAVIGGFFAVLIIVMVVLVCKSQQSESQKQNASYENVNNDVDVDMDEVNQTPTKR